MSDTTHDVTITSPSIDGRGTVVALDGVRVKGVTAVHLDIVLNEPNRLRLEMLVDAVNVDSAALGDDDA